MDRESQVHQYQWETTGVTSQPISTQRAGWQSLHLGATFPAGTITFEVWNEATESWVKAQDKTNADLATVTVAGQDAFPVPLELNHHRIWRMVSSASVTAGEKFATVNKV